MPPSHLHDLLERDGSVIFEAAQGVLLDEWVGFHPHTTWGTITLANADTLLSEAGYSGEVTRLAIVGFPFQSVSQSVMISLLLCFQ